MVGEQSSLSSLFEMPPKTWTIDPIKPQDFNMKTWTPLWSSIVDSSVWGESKETKILWITMLANHAPLRDYGQK